MFGIGFGELMVIAAVILIAVGPRRLPVMMKSFGRAMREFRKATRELRAQVGLDEILNDEDLRNPLPNLRQLLEDDQPPRRRRTKAERTRELLGLDDGASDTVDKPAPREYPPEGVDVAEAEHSHESRSA